MQKSIQAVVMGSLLLSISCSENHLGHNLKEEALSNFEQNASSINFKEEEEIDGVITTWDIAALKLSGTVELLHFWPDVGSDYLYRDKRGIIQLRFGPEIVKNYSLDNFRKYFLDLSFEINLPDNYYLRGGDIRNVTIYHWKDGLLSGAFNTLSDDTAHSRDSICGMRCFVGGLCPSQEHCTRKIKLRRIHVEFNLQFPEPLL